MAQTEPMWSPATGMGRKSGLVVGVHAMKRTPIVLSEEARRRHMYVIGRTGSGKSKLLEAMIRQDIRAGRGVLLLDPHGSHSDSPYQGILRWAADQHLDQRLHLIDLNEPCWVPGLNYLHEPDMSSEWVAGRAQEGIAKVFGGEQQENTPLLWSWLNVLLHALADVGLTLAEARAFIDDPAFRGAVVSRVKDIEVRSVWQAYEHDKRTQEFVIMAVRNRVMPFAGEALRPVVGQATSTIDWLKVMDEGGVVLVNLSPTRVSPRATQMLGVILVHQVLEAAKRRSESDAKRFYVYCDEFQNYVTEDFAVALEEMRKFQVSFVLAHQHLAQLERAGPWIIQSALSTRLKVVFDPGNRRDAEILSKELFTGTNQVTGRRVKDQLNRTFFEPYIVGEGVESTTDSDSYGGSDTWGGQSGSSTSSDSHTSSTTSSVIPVTHHKERREIASRQYVGIDEEFERATGWIMSQADRHALVRIGNGRPMRMVTREVVPASASRQFVGFRSEKAFGRAARPREEVEAEIAARRSEIVPKAHPRRMTQGNGFAIAGNKELVEQE